jgi:hypothetical protein
MTRHETTPRSVHTLSALIGALVLFAALIAGGTLANAGREKLHDPAWTSGTAMAGFLKGAQFKATKTVTNPYPDVLAPVQSLNTSVIGGQTRFITGLVPLAEIIVPIAVLILLCVRFPGSRYAALIASMLAAGMHVIYMLEGSAGENTPLLLMWLTVVWLIAIMPAAALHHALDLGALFGKRAGETAGVADAGIGQWVFFGTVALVIGSGGALLYGLPNALALILVTLALAGLLTLGKRARRSARTLNAQQTQPQPAQ